MSKASSKKKEQLGAPIGTAANRLRKMIMFSLLRESMKQCYRCKKPINCAHDLSIEHKIPWLDSSNPCELFFDLSNIAFSHLRCNIASARKSNRKYFTVEDKQKAYREQRNASMRRRYYRLKLVGNTSTRQHQRKHVSGPHIPHWPSA